MEIGTVLSMSELEPVGHEEATTDLVEGTQNQSHLNTSRANNGIAAAWSNVNFWRVATLATIIAVVLLFSMTRGPIEQFRNSDPVVNGYVPPRNFDEIIKILRQA